MMENQCSLSTIYYVDEPLGNTESQSRVPVVLYMVVVLQQAAKLFGGKRRLPAKLAGHVLPGND